MVSNQKSSLERVVEQHRQLRRFAASLREFVGGRGPDPGLRETPEWVSALGKKLMRLHEFLSRHFREEEESGMFEDLSMHHPHHCRQIHALRNEHTAILRDTRALLNAALDYSEEHPLPDRDLREWTNAVVAQFERHEQEENDFIQRIYDEELGCGD